MSTVKTLYEITCPKVGKSYYRVYVWTGQEKQAVKMALEAFAEEGLHYTHEDLGVQDCFRNNEGDFCTSPNDEGWVR